MVMMLFFLLETCLDDTKKNNFNKDRRNMQSSNDKTHIIFLEMRARYTHIVFCSLWIPATWPNASKTI